MPTDPAQTDVPVAAGAIGSIGWWIRRAAVVGMLLSLVFHAGVLTLSGFIRAGGGDFGSAAGSQTGASGPVPVQVEVAVIDEPSLAPVEDEMLAVGSPEVQDAAAPALPGLTTEPVPGGAGGADAGGDGALGSGLGGAGSGTGLGVGEGSGGGGGGTSFFGVEARGSRIVYICDISGSMNSAGKLATLKRELITSLDALGEGSQFLVIFFESQALPLGAQERWIEASPKSKTWAETQIRGLEARGGTNPDPAFVAALALRPRPDAIYFMTDGEFDEGVVGRVAAMQALGRRVPVHCIAVENRAAEPLMRRIAADSGGSFTFVPGGAP